MSRRRAAGILVIAAMALSMTAGPAVASAAEPFEFYRLSNLRVSGGAAAWSADNDFDLDWDLPPDPVAFLPLDSIAYLVRDGTGRQVGQAVSLAGKIATIRNLQIPPPPGLATTPLGTYTVEVWGRGLPGEGPHASAVIRYDNRRPGPALPIDPGGWIRAGTETVLTIEHPPAPLPISGIRGYAVVVDHGSGGSPCTVPDRCTEAETDLRGGVDDDTISLGVLPEGVNTARVVAVSGSGMRSKVAGSVDLRVDGTEPEVVLEGGPAGWSDGPVRLIATATDPQSGMAPAGPTGPFTAIAIGAAVPTIAPGGSVSATVLGDGIHRIRFYGRDAVGNTGNDEAAARPAGTTEVRIDETPPAVSFLAGQDQSEPERIEATVVDPLSGPDPARGTIAVRPAGSAGLFVPIPTRTAAGRLTALWDSDSYPPGSYEFRATGYDEAGNSTATGERLDGTRMVLSNPLKLTTQVEFGFGGPQLVWHRCKHSRDGVRCRREVITAFEARPAARSIPYGRGVPVAGRLISTSGVPLPGQPVELTETFAAGAAAARRTTTVQTGADGAFLARLAPGPSRSVQVGFPGTRQLTRSGGRTVQLAVRAALRLHASTAAARIGGAPVVFSGQIAHDEARVPAEGIPVQLQFRVGDSPWTEFRTVQTGAQGRFRYPYSFSDDDSRGIRFQFRAYAPASAGWPYAPGFSRPVAVTGR